MIVIKHATLDGFSTEHYDTLETAADSIVQRTHLTRENALKLCTEGGTVGSLGKRYEVSPACAIGAGVPSIGPCTRDALSFARKATQTEREAIAAHNVSQLITRWKASREEHRS